MNPVLIHRPAPPAEPEPPDRLLQLSEHISHPLVAQSGITTTANGDWAVYVTVPANVSVPVAEIESQAQGFPVVYEAEPESLPIARPALLRKRR